MACVGAWERSIDHNIVRLSWLCYTGVALEVTSAGIAGKDSAATSRVWPETAIRLTHRIPSRNTRKPRWLLWLEDPSSDESRRAAAALRFQ